MMAILLHCVGSKTWSVLETYHSLMLAREKAITFLEAMIQLWKHFKPTFNLILVCYKFNTKENRGIWWFSCSITYFENHLQFFDFTDKGVMIHTSNKGSRRFCGRWGKLLLDKVISTDKAIELSMQYGNAVNKGKKEKKPCFDKVEQFIMWWWFHNPDNSGTQMTRYKHNDSKCMCILKT